MSTTSVTASAKPHSERGGEGAPDSERGDVAAGPCMEGLRSGRVGST